MSSLATDLIENNLHTETVQLIRRRYGLAADDGDFQLEEDSPIEVETTVSVPFFRGYFENIERSNEANIRLEGRLVFFMDPSIKVDALDKAMRSPGDIVVYPYDPHNLGLSKRWVVTGLFRRGVDSHSEVLCDIEDN